MSEPVGFEDRLSIATPEGVEVELTLANIGSRFIAGVIDLLIEIALLIALAVLLRAAGSVGAAIYASISFAVIFFYDVLFEVLGGGQDAREALDRPARGPRGRPADHVRRAAALRNILRIIDILPAFYAIGMTAIFVSRNNQRLGDMAAGAHVVRDRYGDRASGSAPTTYTPIDPGPAAAWDVSAVSSADIATVRAFLERRDTLEPTARASIAAELATRLRPRVGGAGEPANETFLALLVAAKAQRER